MSGDYPGELLYTKEHEWAKADGNVIRVGVTAFAVEQLGDVTQVDVPEAGDSLTKEQVFGAVESVKAVSDLFAPVTGKVVSVNEALEDSPELVNEDPYGKGWLIEIELADPAQLDGLLDVDAYRALVAASE